MLRFEGGIQDGYRRDHNLAQVTSHTTSDTSKNIYLLYKRAQLMLPCKLGLTSLNGFVICPVFSVYVTNVNRPTQFHRARVI